MGSAQSPQEVPAGCITDLPPPQYRDGLWLASCRRVSTTRTFSDMCLLFQPDNRLFCADGTECRLLGRNREHTELYIHTTRAVVKAAAAADVASRDPATRVANRPGLAAALPFVQEAWAFDGDGEGLLGPDLWPRPLCGRTVLVWVHGFRQRYFRIVSTADHVLTRMEAAMASRGGSSDPPLVVAFVWPCQMRRTSYATATTNASLAGPHLVALLRALKANGCRTVVAGHSLGCRVALGALLQPPGAAAGGGEQGAEQGGGPLCDHLLLLGAAVPTGALAEGGEFPRSRIAARQVTVLWSARDEVLQQYFGMGEVLSFFTGGGGSLLQRQAMGLSGPQPCPADCTSIDVTETVPSHNPNIWLKSRAVLDRLTAAVLDMTVEELAASPAEAAMLGAAGGVTDPSAASEPALNAEPRSDAEVRLEDDEEEEGEGGEGDAQRAKEEGS